MAQTLDGFIELLGPDPIVIIERDEMRRMARITVSGHHAMGGNFWDFYPGCHGGWHYELAERFGGYSGPEGMAISLQQAIVASGRLSCRIETASYDCHRAEQAAAMSA